MTVKTAGMYMTSAVYYILKIIMQLTHNSEACDDLVVSNVYELISGKHSQPGACAL